MNDVSAVKSRNFHTVAHPMLLFGKIHSKLCRTGRKDCSTQKWRGNELHNQWHHFLMLRGLTHLSNQLELEHTLMRVLWKKRRINELMN